MVLCEKDGYTALQLQCECVFPACPYLPITTTRTMTRACVHECGPKVPNPQPHHRRDESHRKKKQHTRNPTPFSPSPVANRDDIKAMSSDGARLITAASDGDKKAVKNFLKGGVDVNSR